MLLLHTLGYFCNKRLLNKTTSALLHRLVPFLAFGPLGLPVAVGKEPWALPSQPGPSGQLSGPGAGGGEGGSISMGFMAASPLPGNSRPGPTRALMVVLRECMRNYRIMRPGRLNLRLPPSRGCGYRHLREGGAPWSPSRGVQ